VAAMLAPHYGIDYFANDIFLWNYGEGGRVDAGIYTQMKRGNCLAFNFPAFIFSV